MTESEPVKNAASAAEVSAGVTCTAGNETNPQKKGAESQSKLQRSLHKGSSAALEQAQSSLRKYVVEANRRTEALENRAMFFHTCDLPLTHVENPHLKRAFALLSVTLPTSDEMRGILDSALVKHEAGQL
eukprot:jgi/Ulvmu1/9085/UM005_0180.1